MEIPLNEQRILEESRRSAARYEEEALETAIGISHSTAEDELLEDALLELTGLKGKPETRLRLLAVVALDDLQARCVNEGEREVMGIVKEALKGLIYSKIPIERDAVYEAAHEYMEDAAAEDLTVYGKLLPVHERMVEEEEQEAAVEWAAIQEQLDALHASMKAKYEAEAEAEAEAKAKPMDPVDPVARRALVLEAYERRKALAQAQAKAEAEALAQAQANAQ
jgi:hypothetical protein